MTVEPTDAGITVVPANCASWEDLEAVFGDRGYPSRCLCQRFKTRGVEWMDQDTIHVGSTHVGDRALRLREQTACEQPESEKTSGLVAYLDGEPVGWCAVEPRTEYVRLGSTPWRGRDEDETDPGVWAIVCFVTRAGFRRQGVTYALARAAVDFALERGARALEGYPMITHPGDEITWQELHVGARSVFEAAGFTEVSNPSKRRVVMRIEF